MYGETSSVCCSKSVENILFDTSLVWALLAEPFDVSNQAVRKTYFGKENEYFLKGIVI